MNTTPTSAVGAGEPRAVQTPEKALLAAILERAVLDLRAWSQIGRPQAVRVVERINAWMDSDYCGATIGGFSFVFVCAHLGLQPEEIRRAARSFDVSRQSQSTSAVRAANETSRGVRTP